MEIYERVRYLRKNCLHMSQTAFGKHLGVSRSVINNIELDALAKPDQKLPLLRLMCREFNVNEEWLLHGKEPIFVQPKTFSLDVYVKENGGTELEIEILKAYFSIDSATRKRLLEHFKNHMAAADVKENANP